MIYGGDIIYTSPIKEYKEDMPMQNFDEPFHYIACRNNGETVDIFRIAAGSDKRINGCDTYGTRP